MKRGSTVKRTNPGDVANIFVRCMLSDVSDFLGGFTQDDLLKTVEYFDYKCPYTGEDITEIFVSKKWSLDHLIPHNRFNCGLNLYGNIIVTTPKTNGKKSSKDFKKFILEETQGSVEEKEARIAKIIQFQKDSGYTKVMENITELSDLCKKEYDLVEEKLSDLNKEYLSIINKENVIDIVEEDISDSTDDAKITVSTIIPSQPVSMPQNISGNIPDNYFVGKVGKQRAYDYLTSLGINIHTNMNIGKTNKANNKYWVNPEFTCLNSDWSLVLNDTVNKELHIFQIPAGSISSSDLVSRADNNKIDLQIRYADPCYEDTRSKYCFSQWYYKTIQY